MFMPNQMKCDRELGIGECRVCEANAKMSIRESARRQTNRVTSSDTMSEREYADYKYDPKSVIKWNPLPKGI
jgi:hypothetical protein